MINMQCEQFEQILEQQDDGALPKPALAHLESCQACRTLSADFGLIHEMALQLGSEGLLLPNACGFHCATSSRPRGCCTALRRPHGSQATQSWLVGRFQRPAFAGAFLGLVVAAASTVGYLSNSAQTTVQSQLTPRQEISSVPAADSVFKEEVLTVGIDSIPGLQRQDTAVTASIRRNLQIVDNFIAICERAYANNLTIRWRGNICTELISRRRSFWLPPRTVA